MQGGLAIAEILLGITNPSGRMPITYPTSQLTAPHPYWAYVDSVCAYDGSAGPCREEFGFGTGLQYTEVVYSELGLSWQGGEEAGSSTDRCVPLECAWTAQWSCPDQQPAGTAGEAGDDGSDNYYCCCTEGMWSLPPPPPASPPSTGVPGCTPVTVSVTVTNTGEAACKHTVLLFLRDEVRSVTPEDKRLRGFEKVALAPGASETVTFVLTHEHYSFYGIDISDGMQAEPGSFTVMVGPQPGSPLTATFTLDRPAPTAVPATGSGGH